MFAIIRNIRLVYSVSRTIVRTYATSRGNLRDRWRIIDKVYAPFAEISEDSPEYMRLAASGDVWYGYFKPFEISKEDNEINQRYQAALQKLGDQKKRFSPTVRDLPEVFKVQFSHQNVAIEGYTLNESDTLVVYEKLKGLLPCYDNIPAPETLLAGRPTDQVIMIRNQIIALHYALTEVAPCDIVTEQHIQKLHQLLMRDVPTTTKLRFKIAQPGNYRNADVQAKGFPYTVYPYPPEIPALMQRLIRFQEDLVGRRTSIDPLLGAIKLGTAFLHIHPFFDGNGRIGRIFMALVMIRLGYFPIVFQNVPKETYVEAVYQAQQGNPEDLYLMAMEELRAYYFLKATDNKAE